MGIITETKKISGDTEHTNFSIIDIGDGDLNFCFVPWKYEETRTTDHD